LEISFLDVPLMNTNMEMYVFWFWRVLVHSWFSSFRCLSNSQSAATCINFMNCDPGSFNS
jgi:hypothetical protein